MLDSAKRLEVDEAATATAIMRATVSVCLGWLGLGGSLLAAFHIWGWWGCLFVFGLCLADAR